MLNRIKTSRQVLLAVALTSTLAACSSGPKGASEDFYTAAANGQTDKAMKMIDLADMSPQDIAMGASGKLQAVLESIHQKALANGGLDKVKILNVTKIDDSHTQVTAQLVFKDGVTMVSRDSWVKLNGKWLLNPGQN